ncbi:aminotransferase class IV [Ferruginibacter sp. HRS2-29]|uniref:aminotransferase class IV n=1 Tax=Ferruginibacter sp. HRS2-29 TaxID=2487334 RepID=UPI0020CCD1A8|nr:aminotransferase class IV [Ferruginibacter sp. HRS2-29]MCP9750223.1 hypothetical protein [Ferruginibacter sp. HRS2-29]
MRHFIFNGKSFPEGQAVLTPDSRAARYGDGLFETMKLADGKLILADEHFSRLWKGMQLLRFEIPRLFTPEKISGEIFQLAKKNKLTNARIRIAVFRGNGGLYDAENMHPNYTIQAWPLAFGNGQLNNNGLQLGIYRDAAKSCDAFANIKHNNYLPYFMGALFAKENKFNDAVILNQHGRVCDSTIANIFLVKDQTVYTPSLAEGCVAGVLRKVLLQTLPAAGFEIIETEISIEMLKAADEIFLSNSIYNIRWVGGLEDNMYSHAFILKIDAALKQTNAGVFC